MKNGGTILLCLAFSVMLALVFCFEAVGSELFIDVGEEDAPAEFGFGWARFERNRDRSFAWIRYHLEADVWIEREKGGAAVFEIVAAPYYHPGKRQSVGVFVNDQFIAQFDFRHQEGWVFEQFSAIIPEGILRPGRNRVTLRVGYTGWRGYAVAVEYIRLSPHG